ncbi:CvpA family protein [Spiroplasma taiwanense]|uniref:Uncharacterized protein n=1 Tax=Spiroplasma taiwanense CT-1 TaxID=1276220 RepID=S5M0B9_9MOLU|nr:CvpA family protein [Spiroplasma taiwanense]AGR41437.1 hypothetical protein STAIW_v1c08510 [Spiroplasma taiwanense CT-1]
MLINIGPWWLFDLIAISVIIGCTIFGIARGFFMSFYILIVEVIAVIILMFIPALLTNSLNPLVMKLLVKFGLTDLFSAFGDSLSGFITGLLPGGTENLSIDGSGASYEVLKTFSALILYLCLSIFIFSLVNLIGFILYWPIKKKLKSIKVVGSVDTLLGAFNGLALGMILSMSVSFFASFPIFSTDTQKIGLTDTSNWSDQDYYDYIENGGSYKKYSIANNITTSIPSIPIFSFTYTNSCVSKYIIKPMLVMGTELSKNENLSTLSNFFIIYEDLLTEGYSSDNPLKSPITTCIETMPEDSRSIFRLLSEAMLYGSKVFAAQDSANENTSLHSIDLINALDSYYVSTKGSTEGIHDAWLNEEEMVNFYSWAESNQMENPFLTLAQNINETWATTETIKERYIVSVLKNPNLVYKFLKNINYVNSITRKNLDTLPFISSSYSSTYLFQNLEIVPSGELKFGQFSNNLSTGKTIADISINENNFWENYNKRGYYWIRYYFDFANSSLWS